MAEQTTTTKLPEIFAGHVPVFLAREIGLKPYFKGINFKNLHFEKFLCDKRKINGSLRISFRNLLFEKCNQ